MNTMTPVLQFSPEILLQAQGQNSLGIRVALFDVDGVLTDGSLYYSDTAEPLKVFNVLDGQGFLMLRKAGIEIVVITGRDSVPVRRRLNDFGITHAYYGVKDKLLVANQVLDTLGVQWANTAVIGDDWPDLPLFQHAAFAVATANAHTEAKANAHYVTQVKGGNGAVREFCDILLMAGGHYDRLYQQAIHPSGA